MGIDTRNWLCTSRPPHPALSLLARLDCCPTPRSYAPTAKDLASRDVVSRSMTMEIREVRRAALRCACCGLLCVIAVV